ncbi:MAG: LysR substrate-binding domain-containing protein [Pirellulales bacterium]
MATVDGMQNRLRSIGGAGRGTVRVGAIPTIAPYLLPETMKRFAKEFPDAEVALTENLTDHVVRSVLSGELDAALIATPTTDERLIVESLGVEELLLALPRRHRLARRRKPVWNDLESEPFVLLDELHCLGEQIVGFCTQQGCVPTVSCRGVQLLTIQELVAQGNGVSLLPASAAASDRGRRCVYRSLRSPRPTRTIRLIRRRDRYRLPIVDSFVECLRRMTIPAPL